MNRGYTVEEAARVLGIPTERVWDLVARGVFSGARGEDGTWRVNLGGSTQEAADSQPPAPDGSSPMTDAPAPSAGAELSPFRELLTEFRHLTERYGQALLALGEARGEVASLNARVDALETRIDLRLPFAGSAAGRPETVPPAEMPPTDEAHAVIATPLPVQPEVSADELAPDAASELAPTDETAAGLEDGGSAPDVAVPDEAAEDVAQEAVPSEPETVDGAFASDAVESQLAEVVTEESVAESQAAAQESEEVAAVADAVEDAAVKDEAGETELGGDEERAAVDAAAPEEPAAEEPAPEEPARETAGEAAYVAIDAGPALPDIDLPRGELPSPDDEFETIDDLLVLAEGEAGQNDGAAATDEPAAEEAVAAEEAPSPEETPAAEEAAAAEETPAAEEAEAAEETPAAEEAVAAEEAPSPEETPAAEETPAPEEAPAPEETPAAEEAVAAEGAAAAEGMPATEEEVAAEETSATEEEVAAEETSATEEAPAAEETPADEQASVSEEATPAKEAPEAGLPDDGAFAIEEEPTQRRRNNRLSDEIAAALARADDPSPPELPNGTDQNQHAAPGAAREPVEPTQPAIDSVPPPIEPSRQWPPFARRTEVGEEPLLWIGQQPADESDYAAEMEVGSAGWQADAARESAPRQNATSMTADDLGADPYPDQAELIDALGWEQDEVEAIRSLLAGRTPPAREWPAADPDVHRSTVEDLPSASEDTEAAATQEEPHEEEPPAPSSWPPTDRPPVAETAGPAATSNERRFELPGAADLDEALAALRRRSSEEAAAEESRAATERGLPEPSAADGVADEAMGATQQPADESDDAAPRPPTRPTSGLEDPAWSRRSPAANAYRRLRRFLGG